MGGSKFDSLNGCFDGFIQPPTPLPAKSFGVIRHNFSAC